MSVFGGRRSQGINRQSHFESEYDEYGDDWENGDEEEEYWHRGDMSSEQPLLDVDPQMKFTIEAMKNEFGKMLRAQMEPVYERIRKVKQIQTDWRQPQTTNVSYSRRSFWETKEQPKVYTHAYVKPRSDCMSFSNPVLDNGGVVTKDDRKDSKLEVLEELNEEVEEIEAPPGPLTLFDDDVPSVHNQVGDEEQQDLTSLVVEKQVCEDQVQLQKEAEMVKPKEEEVETKENELMHQSLLDRSDDLEWVEKEEKFMGAKCSKGKVLATNDLEFSSIHSFVQEFDDVSSKDAFHNLLSIRGSEHLIGFKGIKKLEEFEEKEKQNFFPFDVGDEQDLRTNPLQEEGNDAARRSWISLYGPRIEDDMG